MNKELFIEFLISSTPESLNNFIESKGKKKMRYVIKLKEGPTPNQ